MLQSRRAPLPTPYLVQNLPDQPWMPADSDNAASKAKWAGYSKQSKRTLPPRRAENPSCRTCTTRASFFLPICVEIGQISDDLLNS